MEKLDLDDVATVDKWVKKSYGMLVNQYNVNLDIGEYKISFWTVNGYKFYDSLYDFISGSDAKYLIDNVDRATEFGVYVEETDSWLMLGGLTFELNPFRLTKIDTDDCTIECKGLVTHEVFNGYAKNVEYWNQQIIKLNNIKKLISKI